ncbi:hypothetical protein FOA52_006903 [Chlamydomonas sp. UWO 241]|nr:hypothetical protein FOA52_006903 [Chlamydomonas sp. UWO 241]
MPKHARKAGDATDTGTDTAAIKKAKPAGGGQGAVPPPRRFSLGLPTAAGAGPSKAPALDLGLLNVTDAGRAGGGLTLGAIQHDHAARMAALRTRIDVAATESTKEVARLAESISDKSNEALTQVKTSMQMSVEAQNQVADNHKRALSEAKKAAIAAGAIELQTEVGALVERAAARLKAELARMAASYA